MTNQTQTALRPILVPSTRDVVEHLMGPLTDALGTGPALLPLPDAAALEAADAAGSQVDQSIALAVATSGSTGEPKIVLLSSDALRASAAATAERLGGHGRWLLALPATHIAGLQVLVRSIVGGTDPVAMCLADGFDPEEFAAASIRLIGGGSGRRYTSLVPTQLVRLLSAGGPAMDALRTFDAVLIGGASLTDSLRKSAEAAGVAVVHTYGSTETAGGCVYDGVPLAGVEVRLDAGARIEIGGATLADGYLNDPVLTASEFSAGWFRTSDLGSMSDDGSLQVVGRTDDVAISGGVNIALSAVDELVASHPGVREAVAVAVPDAEWGERIVAVVVAADPQAPPTTDAVRAHVQALAAAPLAPRELVVLQELPRLPSGKIDRRTTTALVQRLHQNADRLGQDPSAA